MKRIEDPLTDKHAAPFGCPQPLANVRQAHKCTLWTLGCPKLSAAYPFGWHPRDLERRATPTVRYSTITLFYSAHHAAVRSYISHIRTHSKTQICTVVRSRTIPRNECSGSYESPRRSCHGFVGAVWIFKQRTTSMVGVVTATNVAKKNLRNTSNVGRAQRWNSCEHTRPAKRSAAAVLESSSERCGRARRGRRVP